MTRYVIGERYDLIIAHGTLHLIPRDAWTPLIDRIKTQTVPGGFNAVAVFTDEIAAPPDLAEVCVGLFKDGELFDLYIDWQRFLMKSYTSRDEHPGGLQHLHSANKPVARKPGARRASR